MNGEGLVCVRTLAIVDITPSGMMMREMLEGSALYAAEVSYRSLIERLSWIIDTRFVKTKSQSTHERDTFFNSIDP